MREAVFSAETLPRFLEVLPAAGFHDCVLTAEAVACLLTGRVRILLDVLAEHPLEAGPLPRPRNGGQLGQRLLHEAEQYVSIARANASLRSDGVRLDWNRCSAWSGKGVRLRRNPQIRQRQQRAREKFEEKKRSAEPVSTGIPEFAQEAKRVADTIDGWMPWMEMLNPELLIARRLDEEALGPLDAPTAHVDKPDGAGAGPPRRSRLEVQSHPLVVARARHARDLPPWKTGCSSPTAHIGRAHAPLDATPAVRDEGSPVARSAVLRPPAEA